jgi:hypothetical protein
LLLLLLPIAQGPDPPVGCADPPFRVYDSFSSECECSALGTCPAQRSFFPNPNDTLALDITPRTRFQIVGWYCAAKGCNASADRSDSLGKIFEAWPVINLPTAYPQPFGNWSGDPTQISNGGVPQVGNLSLFLGQIEEGIAHWLPDPEWDGHAAIDFEAWSPSWEENIGARIRYQNYSIRLAREAQPHLGFAEAVQHAREAWESASLRWMVAALDTLHSLRPRTRFGFYGLPYNDYDYMTCGGPPKRGTDACVNLAKCQFVAPYKAHIRARNDRLAPLWRASGVLYPSIYLTHCYSMQEQTAYVDATVSEAVRCATLNQPVMPFQWSFYEGSDSKNETERETVGSGRIPLPKDLQGLPFTASLATGARAVIMWDCPAAMETPHTGPGGRVPNMTRDLIKGEIATTVRALVHGACHNKSSSSTSGSSSSSTSGSSSSSSRLVSPLLASVDATGVTLPPAVFGINASALVIIRQLVASGRLPQRLEPALAALRRTADVALQMEGRATRPGGGVAPPGTSVLGCPQRGPWSVTHKAVTPPSGDKHDFAFLNTYSWPCNEECNTTIFGAARCEDWWHHGHEVGPNRSQCDNRTGLPWSLHDGFGQAFGQHDGACGGLMATTATTLARAYYLTQNESYAKGAAEVLRVWFLAGLLTQGGQAGLAASRCILPASRCIAMQSPESYPPTPLPPPPWLTGSDHPRFLDRETAMRPNLDFGAYVPGVENGSCYGIIVTSYDWNSEVTDAVALLARSAHWTPTDAKGMRNWNTLYLDWLLRSPLGRKEFNQSNNHFTWLEVEALALARSTGNTSAADMLTARARSADYRGSLQNQIGGDQGC